MTSNCLISVELTDDWADAAVATPAMHRLADARVLERAKESVAMRGDAAVAVLAGRRRIGDVTRRAVERPVVRALEHGDLDADAADAEDCQRRRDRGLLARRGVCLDALRRPQALIGRGRVVERAVRLELHQRRPAPRM